MRLTALVVLLGAISTCAFATQHDLTADVPQWLTFVVTLAGGGGITALAMFGARRRETNANADKLSAEADAARIETKRNLFDEIDDLYAKWRTERERADRLELEVRQTRELMAVVIAANRMRDTSAFTALFDLDFVDFGVVVSSSDGGRFEYVNRGLCRMLGRSKEEIIRIGWQGSLLRKIAYLRCRPKRQRIAARSPTSGITSFTPMARGFY